MTQQTGEIYDLGYRHYEGPREGRARARQALFINGVRTVIGLGRGWQSKVLPGLFFVAVIIPAVLFSLGASTAEQFEDIPSHADYYRIVAVIVFLFAATIAPELLCPDRRDRTIVLYLVRPLTTTDYVIGRYLAFFSVVLALVLFGQVILFAGLTLADDEPFTYITDNWLDVPRFIVAGIAVALFATTIPLAVSTFTVRRTYAAAIVIALFLVSLPVAGILSLCGEEESGSSTTATQECEPATGSAAKWFALISFPEVPMHVSDIVFDERSSSELAERVAELPDAVPVGWFLILTVVPGLVLWWQYQRLRT